MQSITNGTYPLEVVASRVDEDTLLHLTYRVIRGPHEGVTIEDSADLKSCAGHRKLAALCRHVGLQTIEDSDDLHFREFTGVVRNGKVVRYLYPAKRVAA